MATSNNIKNYTAADIEKYHKGQLSPKEMHDMEKAALDDPFLADAMEGYTTPGVNITADIAALKKRLEERTAQAKIVSLATSKRKSFPLLRIAAILVIITGAGLLTYKFAFNKKEKPLAKNEVPVTQTTKIADSSINSSPKEIPENKIQATPKTNTEKITNKNTEPGKQADDEKTITPKKQDNEMASDQLEGNATVSSPAKPIQTNSGAIDADRSVNNKELANRSKTEKSYNYETMPVKKTAADSNRTIALSKKAADEFNNTSQPSSVFRGRVTDVNNIGVPFANVTNPEENTGTYTDANGYFNLTYPDSVLNVQVRSIGFENRTARLKNNLATNKIVLKDDQNSLSEIVVGNKLPNTAMRSRDANRTLEEPEPADGWTNYDMYLANNLNLPDDYKPKPSTYPSVEVSFELDTNGEPTNFKIEKSLCAKCDKEAIRLIKEGPKWKQNASKHGRTMVTINF